LVREGFEKGVEAQLIGELDPLVPVLDGARGSRRMDSLGDRFLSSAETTADTSLEGGVQS